MRRIFKTTAVRTFTAVLSALLVGALLSLVLRGGASPVTSAVGLIFSPLQGLSASLLDKIKDAAGYFESSAELRRRLEAKEAELAGLREKLVDYDDTKQKLALYENFLGLKEENPDFEFKEAGIIHRDPQFTTFTLNRGSGSGIRKNQPVLLGQYLVGVVVETTPTTAIVNTILNPDVNIAVFETLTGEIGVAAASPALSEQGLTSIPQLERTTSIITGCMICTSGIGGIYPKNLIVGTVSDVTEGEQGFYVTAIIQPAVDFSALRDVLVLIEQ